MRMRVPVLVTHAERDVALSSVLSWTLGSIIEFDSPADSELQLVIGNKSIGRGNAVKVGENFGLRVTGIGDLIQRINALGG
jgi:flagellar motor switch protein FliN/FliY